MYHTTPPSGLSRLKLDPDTNPCADEVFFKAKAHPAVQNHIISEADVGLRSKCIVTIEVTPSAPEREFLVIRQEASAHGNCEGNTLAVAFDAIEGTVQAAGQALQLNIGLTLERINIALGGCVSHVHWSRKTRQPVAAEREVARERSPRPLQSTVRGLLNPVELTTVHCVG